MYKTTPERNPNRKENELYYIGTNYTVDPVVISQKSILLVRRRDNGLWALPGGFIDPAEHVITASIREVREETNVDLTDRPNSTPIYTGRVSDRRSTPISWIETTALLWQLEQKQRPTPGDDAVEARWFLLHDIPPELNGSHDKIISLAKERLQHGKGELSS